MKNKLYDPTMLNAQFGNAEAAGAAAGLVNAARRNVEETQSVAATLSTDAGLTAFGRSERLSEIVYQKLNALDGAAASVLGSLRAQLETQRSRLVGVPKGTDVALEVEIRGHLFALPEAERAAVIAEAFSVGETAVISAVLAGATFLQKRLLLPGQLDHLRAAYLESRSPEAVREIRELEHAIAVGERAVKLARSILTDLPGLQEAARQSLMVKLGMDPAAAQAAA